MGRNQARERSEVGTISTWNDHILLCRRAIEPRYGFWTLPAGFLENDETTAQGAERETLEEAGARIDRLKPFAMIDVPHVNQVHLFYRAQMLEEALDPGEESLEAKLFKAEEIPWEQIAFRTVHKALRWFLEDHAQDPSFERSVFHYDAIALGSGQRSAP
ncbi:MAG: NUDIX domain-containing protein [Betaproteobacteria bacterium]|nr:NUDIX domain-containing protein [Betaproteobacteria bacterium]